MFTGVGGFFLEDFLVFFDEVGAIFEPSDVDSEMIARSLIEAEHLEGRRRTSLLQKAVGMQAVGVGVM